MFLLLCTSCVEQKDTTSIKIDLMATDSDTLYYSSFVDSLSYIPLETKDDCLIREITDDYPDQSIHLHFRHPTTSPFGYIAQKGNSYAHFIIRVTVPENI